MALSLVAACTTQPSTAVAETGLADHLVRLAVGNPLRLGIEYLQPEFTEPSPLVPRGPLRVEVAPTSPRPTPRGSEHQRLGGRPQSERHTWAMSDEELAQVQDPVEREALHFLDDLMGEDRRRLRRDIGTPILTMQASDAQSPGVDLHAEELLAEEESEYLAEHGVDLLHRPLQLLLRRAPLVQRLELGLDEWKQDNVPLSEEYGLAHDSTNLGRLSLRVRAIDPADPIEFAYRRSGVRVGSSQSYLKLGLQRHLSQDVAIDLRARQDYGDHTWSIRADLSWQLSPRTSLHCVAGDDLDFMVTSTAFSLFDSPMDGSPGLLLYAVHLF